MNAPSPLRLAAAALVVLASVVLLQYIVARTVITAAKARTSIVCPTCGSTEAVRLTLPEGPTP